MIRVCFYQHVERGTVTDPTDGVTQSVSEEKDAISWSYNLTPSLQLFHASAIFYAIIASYIEFFVQSLNHYTDQKRDSEMVLLCVRALDYAKRRWRE